VASKPDLLTGERIITNLMHWLDIPVSDSTVDTPKRIAKMYVEEIFSGLYNEPPEIKLFKAGKEYVCVKNIPFTSFCEHHLLPFSGKCGIVYWTDSGLVIGLSKISRIVQYCAAKPTLQEKLTKEIADMISNLNKLDAKGVYVAMSAEHSCMTIRGIKSIGAKTNTSIMLGDIDKNEAIRLMEMDKTLG
jgi:GTP cyclohydrolase I